MMCDGKTCRCIPKQARLREPSDCVCAAQCAHIGEAGQGQAGKQGGGRGQGCGGRATRQAGHPGEGKARQEQQGREGGDVGDQIDDHNVLVAHGNIYIYIYI